MTLQHNRILRFLMVLSAVLLTIFIYASYYSNTVMTLPARLHASVSAPSVNIRENNDKSVSSKYHLKQNVIEIVASQNKIKFAQYLKNPTYFNESTYARQSANESIVSGGITSSTLIIHSIEPSSRISSLNILNKTANIQNAASAMIPNAEQNVMVPSPLSANPKNQIYTQSDPLKGIQTDKLFESGFQDSSPKICSDDIELIKLLIVITSAPKKSRSSISHSSNLGTLCYERDVRINYIVAENVRLPHGMNIQKFVQVKNKTKTESTEPMFLKEK